MTAENITALFTRTDGSFQFARWGRPIAPIVFGLDDASLANLKGAIEAMVLHVGHQMAETDPELGSNAMFFFFQNWDELLAVPDLDQLIPDLPDLVARLSAQKAGQYRLFRFDDAGAIRACFSFIRVDQTLLAEPLEAVSLSLAIQIMLAWGPKAFEIQTPLAQTPSGEIVVHPRLHALLQAAYDPVLPAANSDASHALRLAARLGRV